jgi:hypothetical protein
VLAFNLLLDALLSYRSNANILTDPIPSRLLVRSLGRPERYSHSSRAFDKVEEEMSTTSVSIKPIHGNAAVSYIMDMVAPYHLKLFAPSIIPYY